MLSAIHDRFTEEVAERAARSYGLDPAALIELDGFENVVFDAPGAALILRVGHTLRRSITQVEAELEWVGRLADEGVAVARPVPALDGRMCVPVPDGVDGLFVAAAFEKAPGVILDDEPAAKARFWNARLYEQWGSVTAAVHLHGAVPTVRPHWHEIDELRNLDRHLDGAPADARQAAAEHIARLEAQPTGSGYGLVHGDLTQWNFVVDGAGRLTAFDFDSSMRCWYAMDLAVALYYARLSDDGPAPARFAGEFLESFVRGYRAVRPLPASELALLPDLLMLQTVILYSLSHQNLGEGGEAAAELKERFRRRLLGEEPIVDLGDALERLVAAP